MMAQRKTMPKLHLPCYDLEDVPAAARDLSSSVVVRLREREHWMESLSEMLLLCNEAAARRVAKFGLQKKNSDGTQTKPLGLEYMADRLDTDDPLEGFQVRSNDGWLQGFITTTTFTVWQRAFRWDSLAPESGIPEEDLSECKWDSDNALASELDQCDRSGDPDAEGIIWPKLAEISLLGGLGCGTWLMRLVLEELEQEGRYDYVVVQATDNSVPFYEQFGFIRVGAVAKYLKPDELAALRSKEQAAAKKGASSKASHKKRRVSDGDEEEVKLPDWLKNKRFKFLVGSDRAGERDAGAARKFSIFVDKEWEKDSGFRLYERFCDSDDTLKYREWRCAKDLEPFEVGRQRFVPHKVRAASKPFPSAQVYSVAVHFRQTDDQGKKGVEYVEIESEAAAVKAAYAQFNEHVRAKVKSGEIDWSDHSDANVNRRRQAGFRPYCHWTFPEQSVEDLCPSYMMARRLVKQRAPAGGAIQTLQSRMRDQLPEKKRTRPDPPEVPVNTGHNYDDVTADTIKKSMYNKVVTVDGNKYNYDYYYVLHYILDMDWCHLVPLQAKSHFGGESFRAGRPRYKLVPEGEGRELDLPAARCRQVLAYAVSKTMNADKEVWDIVLPEEKEEYEKKLAEERRRQKHRAVEMVPTPTSSNERPRRRQEPWEEGAMRVMRKLMRRKSAWPFLEPVDPVALNIPDYPDVIKHPMDLSLCKDKLSAGKYPSLAEWRADVELTFENAILYNPAGNPVSELAVEMKAIAVEEINREEVKWNGVGGRPSLVPYGTPHSAVTSTVSSPAASSAGPFNSNAVGGYLGCEGGGPSSAGRVKSEGGADGSGGVGGGGWLVEGHSNGQHAMR